MWQWLKSKDRKEREEAFRKELKQKEADYKEACRLKGESQKKAYEELLAFRKVGEKFNFLGVTMIISSQPALMYDYYNGTYINGCMNAQYVDKGGIIREEHFNHSQLPMLKAENP